MDKVMVDNYIAKYCVKKLSLFFVIPPPLMPFVYIQNITRVYVRNVGSIGCIRQQKLFL